MNELGKMSRVISREIPDAPHEVLLALDATTGQNALNQAKQFKEVTPVTGIILTKLDGTARGGIVLAIRSELHLPVKLVGMGEQMDDLRDFNPEEFVYGLFKGLVTEGKTGEKSASDKDENQDEKNDSSAEDPKEKETEESAGSEDEANDGN